MRRLATHPPAAASITCTDAPIPIRLFIIRPVKRSASTAPDGTPVKKLLSNNFVVRRHVPPRGRNVSIPPISCLPVDNILSSGKKHNGAGELTALWNKYDTGVSIYRRSAWKRSSTRDEVPIFPAVSSLRRKSETGMQHRRDEIAIRLLSPRNSARTRSRIAICIVSVRPKSTRPTGDASRCARYWTKSFFCEIWLCRLNLSTATRNRLPVTHCVLHFRLRELRKYVALHVGNRPQTAKVLRINFDRSPGVR
jgi:hypothetical protein